MHANRTQGRKEMPLLNLVEKPSEKCNGIQVEVPIILLFRHKFKQLSLENLVEVLVLGIALRMIGTGDVALHSCHLTELIIDDYNMSKTLM